MRKKLTTLLVLPLIGHVLVAGAVTPMATHERILDNGLKVIVHEDHRAPVVVTQIWYKVGSSYEYDGITGISHLLEHMMFKGTPKIPAGEFSRIIAAEGGKENAFTGRDYTAYFQQLEKERLPIAMELEADRMRNLLLPEEEFEKERQVVIEERRTRVEDKPSSLTYEQFIATAFQSGPYHHPVVGWQDDLDNLNVGDLRAWYQQWYAPNNATLVVAGDVEPEEIFALATKHYGPLQPSSVIPPKPRREAQQRGNRRVTVRVPAHLPVLLMGFKVPSLRTVEETWKAYALEVLAYILDGGDSARLARELVRGHELAASASASYDLYSRHSTLFTLQGTPANGRHTVELEQALHRQVTRLQDELVNTDELARIKVQVTAGKVYERDSIFYAAMQIGQLATVGLDWQLSNQYLTHISAVTAEQIRAVAREFLINDRLTVAELQPLPLNSMEGKL